MLFLQKDTRAAPWPLVVASFCARNRLEVQRLSGGEKDAMKAHLFS